MAENSTEAQVQAALDASQGQQQQVTEPAATVTEPVQQQQEQQLSDLAQGFLKDVPDNERPIVEKYVKTWDAGVTKQFQSVHSEYEGWKGLKDAGYDPEEVTQAVALVEALNQDPQGTVKAVAEAYGITIQQAAQAVQQAVQPAQQQGVPVGQQVTPQLAQQAQEVLANLPPEVAQRLQMVDIMAQLLVQQNQQAEISAADQELARQLETAKQKYGEFNEEWVLALAFQTGDIDAAAKSYSELVGIGTQQVSAPTVLGGGGGLPSNGVDVTKLNSKDTKALVSQMLDQAKQQG